MLELVGCGHAIKLPDNAGGAAALNALPRPSSLRQASEVTSGVFRFGSQYVAAWPNQLVESDGDSLVLTPAWSGNGLQGAAFAIYAFDSTGYIVDNRLRLEWQDTVGHISNLWVGIANFQQDRWDWFTGPTEGTIAYDRAKYTYNRKVYAIVLCLGHEQWKLSHIRICSGIPPRITGVSPRWCNSHIGLYLSASVEGTAESYNWNFGGAGTPNTSTLASPNLVPGDVGVYQASVVVANAYGQDEYAFDLHVTVPPGLGDWSMFGREQAHNRRSPYPGPQTAHVRWSYTTTEGLYSSPVIGADGTVYVGSNDKFLYALYPDGTLRWRYPTGSWVWGSPALDAEGMIYCASFDGRMYALTPTGKLAWAFQTRDWVRSSPVLGPDGAVYFGSRDGKIYALNPSGTLRWAYPTGDGVDSSPALGPDGTVYIGSDDFNLYALHADGTLKWKFATGNMVWSAPALASDGTIYIGSYDNRLYAINPDGTEKWHYTTGLNVGSSPAIGHDGTIYFGSYDCKFYALNPDGTLKWTFLTGNNIRSSPALDANGNVYFGSDDSKLYALSPAGELLWDFTAQWYVYSSPAIGADGMIYVGGYDGRLYALGDPPQ